MLVDAGILREVSFIETGHGAVYAAMYAPEATDAVGVLICPSWGADVAVAVDASHWLASTLAENGLAAALYHPPGHLDSWGDPRELTMSDLVEAAVACAAFLRERCRVREMRLVGIGLGASIAALAASRVRARALVLVEPALDPAAFFAGLRGSGTRASLRGGDPDMPFGHALPRAAPSKDVADRVTDALAGLPERPVAFRFASTATQPLPAGIEDVIVPGARTGRRWPNRFVQPVASHLVGGAS